MKKSLATLTILILCLVSISFGQNTGDYRSFADGNWSAAGTWETYNGSAWVGAGSAPTGSENISVTHTVTVDVAINVTGYIKVEGAGVLTVGAGSLAFDNGSTYEHAVNGSDIPASTWNAGSTCLVTGVTSTSPGGSNQDFYNFIWNCTGQSSNLDVSWDGNTIGGDVTCTSTGGSNQFRLTSSSDYVDSITINGDVIVTGGVLTATGSSTAMEYTIVVNGSINVSGGSFALSRGSGGNVTWYLGGDLTVANAEVRSSNADAKFLFYTDVAHMVNYNTVSFNGDVNYEVDLNDTLDVIDGPDAVDFGVNGLLTNYGQINTAGAVSFMDGSTYHHAINGGNIPLATWESGSTLFVDAVTNSMPGNRDQDFYDILWDCPGQLGNYNMGFDENTIGGDITINNTGSGRWYLCGPVSGDTVSVDVMGDITLVDGNFAAHGTGNALTGVDVHVYGNITALAGNFSVSRGSQSSGSGYTNFYVHGDLFSLSDVTTQNSNSTNARFIFTGTNPQTLSFTNVTISGGGFPVEIASGSTLDVGTIQFGNSGTFVVNDNATLECGNEGGLDSTLQNSGTTSLSTAGNYTFNGTAAQITGSLLPSTINDLTVNNALGVTLSADVQVDGNLNVNDGDLDLNGNTITLGTAGMLNETAGNTVTGSTGKIMTTRDLNAPAGVNVGGLGAMLTSSSNLGSTMVERYHSAGTGLGNEGIFRQYNIVPTNNSGLNATLRYYYDESELNGISEADLTMFKSPAGANNTWTGVGGTVNIADNYVELSSINDFSYWTLGDLNNPIPVELSSFAASTDGRFVTLTWQTATETNNHGWDVERRVMINENNFSDWTKAGFVEGSGSTTESVSYTFSDKNITSGVFQYRLKQIDFDGTFSYSDIAEVNVNGPTEFALFQNYPNPFNPSTVIRFEIPEATFVNLKIYNAVGEEVATLINEQMESGVYLWNFNAANLPSGIYIYRLNAGDKLFTKKMMLIK